jgi:hypothetical protein
MVIMGKELTDGGEDGGGAVEGVEWLRKAAELGNLEAMEEYGRVLSGGIGVEKDKACAFDWYMKAARRGGVGPRPGWVDVEREGWGAPGQEKRH